MSALQKPTRFILNSFLGRSAPVMSEGSMFGVRSISNSEEERESESVGAIKAAENAVYSQKQLPLGLGSSSNSPLFRGAGLSSRREKLGSFASSIVAEQTRGMATDVRSGALSTSFLLGVYRFWRSQAPFEKPHAPIDSRMLPAVIDGHSQGASVGTWCTTVFVTILACNLLGLAPFNEAPTSGLGFATGLGVSMWATATIYGFSKLGFSFPGHFIPGGTPWPMAFMFVPLETISYSFRAVSLGVRLWVNMLAGHTLLHILTGMSLALPFSLPFYTAVPATGAVCCLLSALVGLEYLVAVLQSGVFAILSSVYIGEFNHNHLAGPLAKVVKSHN
eukprot:gene21862-28892_t